jgi:hypothetical protein
MSGLLYAVTSMAFEIVTPILVIAAGVLFVLKLAFTALGRK